MSPNTPSGLQNKVQFDIRLYFCRRSAENMHLMNKSTFMINKDQKNRLIVRNEKSGRAYKNHREHDRELTSGAMPELQNSPLCPVKSFKKYLSKLHPDLDSLWQRPLDSFDESDEVWYCRSNVGQKTLSKFMSTLSECANLSEVYTNHSIRPTGATILTKNMFNPAQIMAVTGHKSVQSLTVYQRTGDAEKIAMGHAMAQSISNSNDVMALPSTATLALPAPPVSKRNDDPTLPETGQIALPSSSSMTENMPISAELDGINISGIFSDFNAPSNSIHNEISSVQSRQILPNFTSCSIGTINFNININRIYNSVL